MLYRFKNKIIITLLLFVILTNYHLFAQKGHIFSAFQIDNIRANDYLGNVQVWDITECEHNRLFITTANGLSVFDGIRWMVYSTPTSPLFRCIAYDPDSDKLFTGADNQFGYWIQNELGEYIYTPLYVNQNMEKPDIFWRVYVMNEHVYFQTEHSIFSYCKKTQLIDTLFVHKSTGYLHSLNDKLYVQINNELNLIEKNQLIPIQLTTESRIVHLFGKENHLIAATERNGLLIQDQQQFVPLNEPTNALLEQSVVFSACQFSDSIYLIGTVLDGVYVLDSQGNIIEKISQAEGLRYTTVLSMYVDSRKNVWLGLDGGLAKAAQSNRLIEQTIDFSKYGVGRIYTMAQKDGCLFLGTNKGLYQQCKKNQPQIIPSTQGQVWNIVEANNNLIVCHDRGVFLINDQKKEWLNVPSFWTIKPLYPDLGYYLSVDFEGGFSLYQIQADKVTYLKKLNGYDGAHSSFDIDRYGNIWVIDRINQPVHIIINKTSWEIERVNKHQLPIQENDLKASLLDGDVIFYNESTAYKYDKLNNSMIVDPYYSQLIKETESAPVVFTQVNDYFFYLSTEHLGVIKRENNQFLNHGTIFKNQDIKTIPPLGRKFIYSTPHSIAIGLQDKIGLYNIDNLIANEKQFQHQTPSITKIELDVKGKTILLPIDFKKEIYQLPFNYFRFNIYLANLSSNSQVAYRINKGKWVIDNADPFLQLPYLEAGSHQVDITNLPFDEEEVITLNIQVKAPWYLSIHFLIPLAIVLFLLGLLLRFFMRHRIKKQQEKYQLEQSILWEKEKNEHEIKLLKLKLNEEEKKLINSTMHAIKRNAMLSKIRDEVATIIPLSKDPLATSKLKNAVKTIESYLDNKENWAVFEKYFNNLYDGFFDRLISKYPNITPNEMKLCALIKLNFPNKEIAAYFNITESSVEIARYRLRKKVNLEHDQSLFTFISSI